MNGAAIVAIVALFLGFLLMQPPGTPQAPSLPSVTPLAAFSLPPEPRTVYLVAPPLPDRKPALERKKAATGESRPSPSVAKPAASTGLAPIVSLPLAVGRLLFPRNLSRHEQSARSGHKAPQ